MKNILCTICMRGSSKGVKNKNIININGKPLLYYTISKAINSKIFNEIVASSDSEKILSLSKKFGVKNTVKRPKILSNDKSGKVPAIKHALLKIQKRLNKKFDYVIDLDVNHFIKSKSDNLVSATYSRKSPYFNIIQKKKNKIELIKNLKTNILRRQDVPITYDLNASIYIWKSEALIKNPSIFQKKTSIYLMPKLKSFDIDDVVDLKITKLFLGKKNEK